MTTFVLVPGPWSGGWVWREVASRLRAAGDDAYEVTLTGLGDRRHLARPDTGLETHAEDLVQVLDHLDEPEVVLVAHCYGVHPATMAAGRRRDRVSRIVAVDSGVPVHGATLLDLIPDEKVRELTLDLVTDSPAGRVLAPPPAGDERLWGSLEGVSPGARERLYGRAAPQPMGCYTTPIELPCAVADMPTTGVFCTANGLSIARLEAALATGDPALAALAGPRMSYADLGTGHWPMLSAPEALAEVLREAAAGRGYRMSVA